MDDNDDIYCYNNIGIFVNGGSTIIKKQIELLYPNATTYKVHEITNQIQKGDLTHTDMISIQKLWR